MSPMVVGVLLQRSTHSGRPLQGSHPTGGSHLPKTQRSSPPVLLGPSPRRHRQRPPAAVWCSALLTCLPYLRDWRCTFPQSDNLVPKSADALSPKRTGPGNPTLVATFLDPAALIITWSFGRLLCLALLYPGALVFATLAYLIKNHHSMPNPQAVGQSQLHGLVITHRTILAPTLHNSH